LRQLVEAGHPQEPAQRSDAGIVAQLLRRFPFGSRLGEHFEVPLERFLGVDHHGAELEALEALTTLTDPLMREQDRTAVGGKHDDGDEEHGRQGEYQHDRGRGYIKRPLGAGTPTRAEFGIEV
jgi:hypothetical protein